MVMGTLFFWLSKLGWQLVDPANLLIVTLIACIVLLKTGRTRAALRLAGALSAVLLLIALFPVNEWLLYPLEARFAANPPLPAKVDGIIELGGAEETRRSFAWQDIELNDAAERELAFIKLARRYPHAQLLFSGQSGHLLATPLAEADVVRAVLREQGIDPARVLFEATSRNTAENATRSKLLAHPQPGQSWVLITSAAHMPRAVGIFCKLGWPVLPYPVDHRTERNALLRIDLDFSLHLYGISAATHEWLGLLAYYAAGKTSAPFPRACAA